MSGVISGQQGAACAAHTQSRHATLASPCCLHLPHQSPRTTPHCMAQGVHPAGLAKVQQQDLREFIQLCINHDPEARPEARQLLKSPYFESIRTGKLSCPGVDRNIVERNLMECEESRTPTGSSEGSHASDDELAPSRSGELPAQQQQQQGGSAGAGSAPGSAGAAAGAGQAAANGGAQAVQVQARRTDSTGLPAAPPPSQGAGGAAAGAAPPNPAQHALLGSRASMGSSSSLASHLESGQQLQHAGSGGGALPHMEFAAASRTQSPAPHQQQQQHGYANGSGPVSSGSMQQGPGGEQGHANGHDQNGHHQGHMVVMNGHHEYFISGEEEGTMGSSGQRQFMVTCRPVDGQHKGCYSFQLKFLEPEGACSGAAAAGVGGGCEGCWAWGCSVEGPELVSSISSISSGFAAGFKMQPLVCCVAARRPQQDH